MKLHLRSMDDLEEILDRFIVLGQTTTSIIHSSPLAGRAVAARGARAHPLGHVRCLAPGMSEAATTVRGVRLIVARCEVVYTGRLNAVLPVSTRLLMLKSDGSVLVHADSGGYKPLNWMTPPTVIEEDGNRIVVRKRAGRTETGWRSTSWKCSATPTTRWAKRRRSKRTASRATSRSSSPRSRSPRRRPDPRSA